MSNFTDIQQGIEAVSRKLSELNDQRSKSDESMLCLTHEVEDCVRRNQAEMVQNRAEYERIMREYEQARQLLNSLELLALNASSRCYPTGIIRDLDAITKILAPGSTANVNREAADPGALPDEDDEDDEEVDPDLLRLGIRRCLLKKKGNGVPKEAEAPEPAT